MDNSLLQLQSIYIMHVIIYTSYDNIICNSQTTWLKQPWRKACEN
jgi:hypothetical protein